ncbi:hypothetical protein IMSAGC022_00047 [Alistipes sp.]|nr:hypothetical protein IMSAGC022_00047 [Alistipes sp.]
MHLTVVDHDADVARIRSRKRAFVHLLHDTLQYRRHEAGIDGASDDRVVILQLTAPRQVVLLLALDVYRDILAVDLVLRRLGHALVIGLDDHVHLAELSRTARLLLVTVVGLRDLGNGLPVRNLRREELHLHFVLCRKTIFQDVEMMLALPLYNSLFQLFRVLDQDSRILVLGIVEQLAQLLLVVLLLGLDRRSVTRLGEYDRLDANGGRRRGERVVGARTLQLDGAADIAGRQLADLDAVLAGNGEELRQLLLVARAAVDQLHALGYLAAHNAEIGNLADMLFELALEYEQRRRSIGLGMQLLALGGKECRSLQRARSHVYDELHKTLGADVALAAGAEDRHHVALRHAEFQTRTYVVLRQRTLLEVELHKCVVVHGGRLGKLLIERCGALLLLGRYFQLLARAVIVLEAVHLHHQHVDERVEARTLIHGILHDDGLHGRIGRDALDGSLEVGLVAVELVHHADKRFVEYAGVTRLQLAANLPAVLGVEHHDAHVAHLECREEVTAEIVRSGTVYYI